MTAHLAIGVGCRRGTSADAIEHAVRVALGTRDLGDIACIASIDVKRDEDGLLAFCTLHRLPLRFYSANDIAQVASILSARSPNALAHLNADGVCEPCALLASDHGSLVVGKTIVGGVTVAIAQTSLKHEA